MNKTLRWLAPLALLCFTATAHAGVSILSLVQTGTNTGNGLNAFYATDANGNPVDVLQPGDVLHTEVNFTTFNQTSDNVGGLTPVDEFTAVSQMDVTSATPIGTTGSYLFTFGPNASFENTFGNGAMIAFFEDTNHDYAQNYGDTAAPLSSGPSDSDAVAALFSQGASNGSLFWVLGLPTGATAPTVGWQAVMQGGNNLTNVANTNDYVVQFANFNFALDRLMGGNVPAGIGDNIVLNREPSNSSLFPFTGPADVLGSGSWNGVQDINTPFQAESTDQISFNSGGVVPEPGSLTVWGLIGLVFGGASWRHRRRLLALA